MDDLTKMPFIKLKKHLKSKGIPKEEVDACPDKDHLLICAEKNGISTGAPAGGANDGAAKKAEEEAKAAAEAAKIAEAEQAKKDADAAASKAKTDAANKAATEAKKADASTTEAAAMAVKTPTQKALDLSTPSNAMEASPTAGTGGKKLTRVQQMALAAQSSPILGVGVRPKASLKTAAKVVGMCASTGAASSTVGGTEPMKASEEKPPEVAISAKPKGASGRRLPTRRPRQATAPLLTNATTAAASPPTAADAPAPATAVAAPVPAPAPAPQMVP